MILHKAASGAPLCMSDIAFSYCYPHSHAQRPSDKKPRMRRNFATGQEPVSPLTR